MTRLVDDNKEIGRGKIGGRGGPSKINYRVVVNEEEVSQLGAGNLRAFPSVVGLCW